MRHAACDPSRILVRAHLRASEPVAADIVTIELPDNILRFMGMYAIDFAPRQLNGSHAMKIRTINGNLRSASPPWYSPRLTVSSANFGELCFVGLVSTGAWAYDSDALKKFKNLVR